jgi:hypothetical protein
MVNGPRFRLRIVWSVVSLLLLFGLFVFALTIWALDGPLYQPSCSEPPPFARPLSSHQAVFIAKVLWVGRIERGPAAPSGHTTGHWAFARVTRRYWGLPWWSSEVVFLADGGFEKGEEVLVDGDRSSLVSNFVPLVYIGNCTRSKRLERADIDLRILGDGPPKSSVRIIGRVVRQPSGWPQESVRGMTVEIIGPAGRSFRVSDAEGVYDATGLPPGHYSLSVESAAQLDYLRPYTKFYHHDLNVGDVWGETLPVQ